ncbi:MAG: tRNA pseudouridine synthase B [Planctomycetaceae bacterium]|nr:MAG: tRNA pseudouridine synthase B [Planctomycetaceae bacterium]
MPWAGYLCVNKPTGYSSRDVLNRVHPTLKKLRPGHAGTLDPLATGVLVVAVGVATRLIRYVHHYSKTYVATFRCGWTSDTDDVTGQLTPTAAVPTVTTAEWRDLLSSFVGEQWQVPPQFSAVHVQGQRAYLRARRGETVPLAPRRIVVHRLELLSWLPPDLQVHIECSSGTYVRALGRDLGHRLGCGMVMSALQRTSIGPFTLDRAIKPEVLQTPDWPRHLWPLQTPLSHLPQYCLSAAQERCVCQGQRVQLNLPESLTVGQEIALMSPAGALVAIGEILNDRPPTAWVQPRMVLHVQESQRFDGSSPETGSSPDVRISDGRVVRSKSVPKRDPAGS